MDRRKFLIAASGSVAVGLALPQRAVAVTMNELLPAGAVSSGILDSLRGKKPLIKRSFRPPNCETPVEYFRHAFTPNEAFYVRWHGAVPEVALADWRLKVAGPAARSPREFSYAELRKQFDFVEVAAVNQCSGNRRGLFGLHVPGVQWGYGAMGNAVWRGVRLKDVLEAAGIAGNALEVVGNGADALLLIGPDFIKSLPLWKALDPDTLIAFHMNGAALPVWNGGPARLVVPGWTATCWIKSLTDLQVTDNAFDSFWMKTGYRVPKGMFGDSGFPSQDTEANSPITAIRVNSLVVGPAPGATTVATPGGNGSSRSSRLRRAPCRCWCGPPLRDGDRRRIAVDSAVRAGGRRIRAGAGRRAGARQGAVELHHVP